MGGLTLPANAAAPMPASAWIARVLASESSDLDRDDLWRAKRDGWTLCAVGISLDREQTTVCPHNRAPPRNKREAMS